MAVAHGLERPGHVGGIGVQAVLAAEPLETLDVEVDLGAGGGIADDITEAGVEFAQEVHAHAVADREPIVLALDRADGPERAARRVPLLSTPCARGLLGLPFPVNTVLDSAQY